MFYLKVEKYFAAAHNLINYEGKCEALHGHNWKVEVIVKGDKLDDAGMLIDFKILKSYLEEIIEYLDHKYINELPYFKNISPSSEYIAQYIYKQLEKKLLDCDVEVYEVSAWESNNSCAIYRED